MEWRDTIDPRSIPDHVLKSEIAFRNQAKRKTFGAGTGRPPLADRCPCGRMTTVRAAKRNHKCEPPAGAAPAKSRGARKSPAASAR